MKRRDFMVSLTQATVGVFVGNYLLISCSIIQEDLHDILGKNSSVLKNYTVEYAGNISCLSLNRFNALINGEKAFVFVKNNIIIGYSIKFTNSKELSKIQIGANAQQDFDNAFGARNVWKDAAMNKSITIPKKYPNLKSPFFYSEYLEEAKTSVF